ncbi:hypothetical protein CfE428DRAFT_5813 [Chthoniobacter flavus Ellin428]|uniref:Uncharacterized protein n=1 Tax=Chthoniobacter flavus Ellin428 TaxID=497964 RepID=B4DA73_9BACT|nr:hypothetical protein [Chthoniobacter flavus]EDY16700.1 hypothetical protein CfE428DRAFT_5813 [Chthoniobacter flavus Ellin428]
MRNGKMSTAEKGIVLPLIKRVLKTGKRWESKSFHFPAEVIIDLVLSIEGMAKGPDTDDARDGFSTNGWQWDWWQTFIYQGRSYTLGGSGFYGGHTFGLTDE